MCLTPPPRHTHTLPFRCEHSRTHPEPVLLVLALLSLIPFICFSPCKDQNVMFKENICLCLVLLFRLRCAHGELLADTWHPAAKCVCVCLCVLERSPTMYSKGSCHSPLMIPSRLSRASVHEHVWSSKVSPSLSVSHTLTNITQPRGHRNTKSS